MIANKHALSPLERVLTLFTKVRPGEGASILIFASYGFLLLTCYYILKTLRESLLLTEFDAEAGSYATAVQAILLIFIVPLYGLLFRHERKSYLVRWITLFFVSNIVIFYMIGKAGISIGFFYYVWTGIFGVMMIAQFWAFAADCYNVKSGQRLFPVIMVGALAGALMGTRVVNVLSQWLMVDTLEILLVAGVILAVTVVFGTAARDRIPDESRSLHEEPDTEPDEKLAQALGGFALVLRDRYLLMIALLVVILNWVNTTGETILREFIKNAATSEVALAAAQGVTVELSTVIERIASNFIFSFTLLGLLIQFFLVSRVYRYVGVSGALLVLPIVAALGYGLMSFMPIFTMIYAVKVLENATDYSIMNTSRQALFLPTDRATKYEGKTAIDTFFWRFGDLVQAGVIYVGLNVFGMALVDFAVVNLFLALVWIGLAVAIGRQYRHLVKTNVLNQAPELARPIPDLQIAPGSPFEHVLHQDTFVDADPGDVLTLSAALPGGAPLPDWVAFDPHRRAFSGHAPTTVEETTVIEVTATDFEGLSAAGRFMVRRVTIDSGDR